MNQHDRDRLEGILDSMNKRFNARMGLPESYKPPKLSLEQHKDINERLRKRRLTMNSKSV